VRYLNPGLDPALLTSLLLALLIVIGAAWGVWAYRGWMAQRERRAAQTVAAVMSATTLRRSLPESLSVMLERTAETLGALSACLHVVEGYHLRLVHTVGVERLDLLAHVPIEEALVVDVIGSADGLVTAPLEFETPWAALASGQSLTLSAARIGSAARPAALMVLAWPATWQAESNAAAVAGVCRYAQQMLAEFDDIERRAQDVRTLTTALQRQELLARTMAHDLANKLVTACGLLHAAEDGPPVSDALRQLELMDTMLSDLLDPERPIEPEAVPVEEIVELAAGMMSRPQSEGLVCFNLAVEPGLPDVWGERLAILRVLDNLLMNAIRHNVDRPGVRVWLNVRRSEEALVFEVGDAGGGLAPETQSRLFEFGVRADSTGKVRGHGMGLWSCRRIVVAHGGSIWVESGPGQGARLFFTLPIAHSTELLHAD
jgi:signal transduction histidine kinase